MFAVVQRVLLTRNLAGLSAAEQAALYVIAQQPCSPMNGEQSGDRENVLITPIVTICCMSGFRC